MHLNWGGQHIPIVAQFGHGGNPPLQPKSCVYAFVQTLFHVNRESVCCHPHCADCSLSNSSSSGGRSSPFLPSPQCMWFVPNSPLSYHDLHSPLNPKCQVSRKSIGGFFGFGVPSPPKIDTHIPRWNKCEGVHFFEIFFLKNEFQICLSPRPINNVRG